MRESEPLRLLLLEDSVTDAIIIETSLSRAGVLFNAVRVDNEDAFRAAFAELKPDVVLSDYNVPRFRGDEALAMVRAISPEQPFIFVSGFLGDELAVELMRNGATDHVRKENLDRLPFVMTRAIDEAEQRTARRRTDVALIESEARYRRILETALEGVWTIDAESRTNYVNPKMSEMLGYTVEDMIGRNLHDFMDEAGRAISDKNVERRRQGIAEQHEFKFRRNDGSDLWALVSTNPITDANGDYAGALAMVSDVTAKKKSEMALQESEALFRAVFEQAAVGISVIDSNTGQFLRVNQRACDIARLSREEMVAETFMALTHPDDLAADLKNMEKLKAGEIRTFSMEKRYLHSNGDITWFNLTVSPMWAQGEAPTRHIAVVEDITERKRAQQDLIQSKKRFRALFENAGDAMFLMDNNQFVDCNTRALSLFGCDSRQQFIDCPPYEFSPPTQPNGRSSREQAYEKLAAARSSQPQFFEWVHSKFDGTLFPAEINLTAVEFGDTAVIQAIVRDISVRKAAEAAMKESEQRFRAIFEQAAVGVALIDSNTERFVTANERYCSIVGVPHHQLFATSLVSMTHPDDLQADIENMELLKNGAIRQFSMEKRYVRPDGTIVWVNLTVSPMWNPGESVTQHVAVVEDITERKRTEAALGATADLQERTGELAKVGGWELDVRSKKLFLSLETYRIFELATSVEPSLSQMVSFFESDARATIESAIQAAIDHGTSYDFELPAISAKGRPIWVRAQGKAVKCDGKSVKLLGALHDITERKRAQNALAASEAALRDSNELLQKANAGLELRVAERTARLRALTSEITRVEERERQRVADVLHEGLLQFLAAALMYLGKSKRYFPQGDCPESLTDVERSINQAIDVGRTLTYELCPPTLRYLGIGAALEWLCRRHMEKFGLAVEIEAEPDFDAGDEELGVTLIRAAHELLFNVFKHSKVRRASIRLSRTADNEVSMTVRDSGEGFDPESVRAREGLVGGFGMFRVREQTEALGGRFELSSAPGRGTEISLTFPVVLPTRESKSGEPPAIG